MLAAPVLPKVEVEVNTEQYGRYIIGPLESGYGVTLGNSIRRVLLASLEGAAITAVRITDIPHEFMAIPGVREDVLQVILRLKLIRLNMEGDGPHYMTLRVEGEGVVTAGDIIAPPEVEIVNPDVYPQSAVGHIFSLRRIPLQMRLIPPETMPSNSGK